MREADGTPGIEAVEGTETDEWTVARNPAMRALLDHVAEELAAEFVRLMKASVVAETEPKPEEERR